MGENNQGKRPVSLRQLWARFGYLVVTAGTVILLFGVLLLLAYVPTGSMEPTLPVHSLFVASRLPYTLGDPAPDYGDIMVFQSDELGQVLVKRVIGLPGDTIHFADGYVLRNGERIEEDYLAVQGVTYPSGSGDTFTVPEGTVFFLGDHREDSLDSRYWENPFVPLYDLKGRALVDLSLLPGNTWLGIRLLHK